MSAGSAAAGAVLKSWVDHLLGRGKVKLDEASQIRSELRSEIERKNKDIEALEKRVDSLEEELEKVERERNAIDVAFSKYKLDVYRLLVEAGVNRDLLNSVLALR